jgi:hypothetical protein
MEGERRANSLEAVLVSMGHLEEQNKHIHETVCSLNERVGLQNGRVGKLEKWHSYLQGSITILILMVVPIIINFVSSWLKFTFIKGA